MSWDSRDTPKNPNPFQKVIRLESKPPDPQTTNEPLVDLSQMLNGTDIFTYIWQFLMVFM